MTNMRTQLNTIASLFGSIYASINQLPNDVLTKVASSPSLIQWSGENSDVPQVNNMVFNPPNSQATSSITEPEEVETETKKEASYATWSVGAPIMDDTPEDIHMVTEADVFKRILAFNEGGSYGL
jgi:hypothetical protein